MAYARIAFLTTFQHDTIPILRRPAVALLARISSLSPDASARDPATFASESLQCPEELSLAPSSFALRSCAAYPSRKSRQ